MNTVEEHLYHEIDDAAKGGTVAQYYEITMSKTVDGETKVITSVSKDTDAMGKFRITMPIPEEYRGYARYSVIHIHEGETVTLVDLDDDPNTVTFEVDRFSTFVLTASEQALTQLSGDVTDDGVLDTADVRGVIQHTLGETVYTDVQAAAADYDSSGTITSTDARQMLCALAAED